ncbi:hypothetical protein KY331_01470 [Candidatus Woesearchaeota archaeon]|nr:hypothetical protein [Candidatus Woesearchaeota archaeon]
MKQIVYVIVFLILVSNVLGATVFGSVYNFDLEKQENAIVTVDSMPKQMVVAVDGDYSFELPVGKYKIEAKYVVYNETQSSVSELIDVANEGEFRIDLILFPSFEEEEEILNETELMIENFEEKDYSIPIMFAIVFVIGVILYFISKKLVKPKEIEVDEAKKVIEFIKKQGGRVTQKDIRKNFPSSEAKISLVLTELEEKGVVKKIKRGRGNIIVLKS